MNTIGRIGQEAQHDDRPTDRGSEPKEASMNHNRAHSMRWHMLAMIGVVAGGAVLGLNVAGLFCAVMMVPMIWMMVAPVLSRRARRAHETR